MGQKSAGHPDWVTCGKTIRKLIAELQAFENQDLKVKISLDDGVTHKPISMAIRANGYCLLVNSEM